MRTLIVLVALMLGPGLMPSANADNHKPNVLILTTGGTIASRTDAPLIDGHRLVRAVPELLDHAEIDVEEFSVIGSSKMTPDHWLRLAQRVNSVLDERDDLNGLVITHGTDTMEETAYFLHLTVKSDKPVVVVGSMRSSNEISADGPANLINAVRVAGHPTANGHGVLIVLNEDISSARDVWKTDNRRVQTFSAQDLGHIGTVDPDGVRFYRKVLQPHTTATEFDVMGSSALPDVAILSDYTGLDASLVESFAANPMDGLVVRTFAGGRMSAGMLEGLERIADRGIPTVVTSRVPGGRIVGAPDYPFPAVVADGQPDNKARILLMLALISEAVDVQKVFDTY